MIPSMRLIGAACVFLMGTAVSACDVFEPSALREEVITVINLTDESMTILAVEREVASRLDINPTFSIDPDSDRIIPPGGSTRLSADDIWDVVPGDDVVVFLYSVEEGEANYRGSLSLTDEELRNNGYRVEVAAFPFPWR